MPKSGPKRVIVVGYGPPRRGGGGGGSSGNKGCKLKALIWVVLPSAALAAGGLAAAIKVIT